MRRLYPILLITAVVLVVAALRITAFVHLFFEHAGIAITQDQIKDAHLHADPDSRPQVVPKIIHQVYHDWRNTSIPSDWDKVRQSCIDVNPGWEYKLWTLETSRDFIETNYPWFLRTYDGYQFPVQRVDTVRYFLLLHYGGIYLDLDNGCLENLDPLLYYPAWTTDGGRGALSNNILGARPNHPFWALLTQSLIPYDWNYVFPYVTISFASGQWFETAIWEQYHAMLPASHSDDESQNHHLHRIMMDDRPGTDPWIFFTQERGGTWLNWDNALFLWIGDHLILLAVGICSLTAALIWAARALYLRMVEKSGYLAVDSHKRDDDAV